MLSYCKEMSSLLSNVCVQVKAAQEKVAEPPLHNLNRGGTRSEEKELEGKKVAGTVPGASDHSHGCEGSRETNVDAG